MRRFRNPRYAPEFLERKLCPSAIGGNGTATAVYSTFDVTASADAPYDTLTVDISNVFQESDDYPWNNPGDDILPADGFLDTEPDPEPDPIPDPGPDDPLPPDEPGHPPFEPPPPAPV